MKKFYSKPELEVTAVAVDNVTCSVTPTVDKEIYKQGDATAVGTVNYGEIFGA